MSFGKDIENDALANGDWPELDCDLEWRIEMTPRKTTRKRAPRQTLSGLPGFNPNKPTLVIVGESMVDPADVAAIKKIRSKTDLYIVILKSQPNMEYPLWANAAEVSVLMSHFNIVG